MSGCGSGKIRGFGPHRFRPACPGSRAGANAEAESEAEPEPEGEADRDGQDSAEEGIGE